MKSGLAPVLLLTAASISAGASTSAPAPTQGELARLSSENELLKQQLDLAKAKEFYILLDPKAQKLTLMYHAALLQQYRVEGIEVGVPRIVYHARSDSSGWEGRIWEKGTLDPARDLDRVEVQAPTPTKEGTELEVRSLHSEEEYPVPPRAHPVRGATIDQASPSRTPSAASGPGSALRFRPAGGREGAARPAPSDAVRLHVVMSKKTPVALSLPDTRLLVLPQ
jgi:hypothetical protein